MDPNKLWAQLEEQGEEEVRRKWHQGLYGHPGSIKHQQVQGWLGYQDWKRNRHTGAKASGPPKTEELDDLLPLYRRGVFDRDLQDMTRQAVSGGFPLSLVLIDPDNFKEVNDSHGHPTGDQVLLSLSSLIERWARGKGTAYRYGGDEVAILLPNFSIEEVTTLAEVLRKEIEGASLTERNLKITASLGVATVPEHAQGGGDLLARADEALYQAKRLGRNLVRISGENESVSERARKIERRKPTTEEPVDGDEVWNRVNGVNLSVSVESGYATNFLIMVDNLSDEEVDLEEIRLESNGYRLTEPAHPPSKDVWKVRPRNKLSVGWHASPDPVHALLSMNENAGLFFKTGIEIVLRCGILGKIKEFSQKILVQVDVNNRHLRQLVG